MPRLHDVQRAMRDALLRDEPAVLAPWVEPDGLSAEARLAIYRNNFLSAATRALRMAFPAIDALVGAPFFDAAAAAYVRLDPPRSGWFEEYGAGFAAFLADFPPAAGVSYLPGVARLEWAVACALRASHMAAMPLTRLAALAQADHADLRFRCHPSLGLLRADHPVDDIWRATLAGTDAALAAVDADGGGVALAVQRRGDGVAIDRLDPASWTVLAALRAGRTVGAALASCPPDDAPFVLGRLLAEERFIGAEPARPGDEETAQ